MEPLWGRSDPPFPYRAFAGPVGVGVAAAVMRVPAEGWYGVGSGWAVAGVPEEGVFAVLAVLGWSRLDKAWIRSAAVSIRLAL